MIQDISITDFLQNSYDLIIDARSPKEFEHSHIPSAKNFYALDDVQHHEIGDMYKNISKSQAKVFGASYICQNAALHVKQLYENYPIGSKIAIYCARGGLRSQSLGVILSQIGYVVHRIDRGYKAYRSHVVAYLDSFKHSKFISLCGNTGCGKSELLEELSPSVDIEGLTNHYGSRFGGVKGKQPSQKSFQNTLFESLQNFNENDWVFAEAESKRLGKLIQPPKVFDAIHSGFDVLITAPIDQRVRRIIKYYEKMDDEFFYEAMEHISVYIEKKYRLDAINAYQKDQREIVAQILLEHYYDKVYKKPQNVKIEIYNDNPKKSLAQLKDLQKELAIQKHL